MWLGHLGRLTPLGLSGFWLRFYPESIAAKERASADASCSLANLRLRLDCIDLVARYVALRGVFDWGLAVLASSVVSRGETIVEVGANIGTETLYFSRLVGPQGRVVGFEPVARNLDQLREHIARNEIKNVTIHPAAVGDRAGVVRFAAPRESNNGLGRVVPGCGPRADETEVVEVPLVTLDDKFAAGELGTPKLISMDVEGFEFAVLRGAEKLIDATRPYMIIEITDFLLEEQGTSPGAILEFLQKRDYAVYNADKWKLRTADAAGPHACNWFAIPDGNSAGGQAMARRVSRRMLRAGLTPAIAGINPAVVR